MFDRLLGQRWGSAGSTGATVTPVDVVAVLMAWKAMIMPIALGGVAFGVRHRVRSHTHPDISEGSRNGTSRAPIGPVRAAGPTVGWYIRAVDWPDAEM